MELLKDIEAQSPIRRAVGIAVLNALAEICWNRRPEPAVQLRSGVDAFDAAGIRRGDNVVVIGAFVPFLRALKKARQHTGDRPENTEAGRDEMISARRAGCRSCAVR
jgi:uncharacterized protein (DUF4213/DUF364 family)